MGKIAAPAAPAKNTAAPVQGGAKPGTAADVAAKPKRIDYVAKPGATWVDEKGKLTAFPGDFDPKVHTPINRKAFADDALFWEYRATEAEKRAADYRRRATEAKSLGNVKDKAKAKQLLRMTERLETLKKTLAADGVDVAAILASLTTKTDEASLAS